MENGENNAAENAGLNDDGINTENQNAAEQNQDLNAGEGNDNAENNNGENNDNSDDGKYGSPENYDYSTVALPEGMQLDAELVNEFNPLAKELNLSNDSANKLMALGVKLAQKNAATFKEAAVQAAIAEKNSYLEQLNSDKELNVLNTDDYNKYLDVANQGYNAVATKEFKAFVNAKGLTHHPEFIKVFHKIGELCSDSSIPDAKLPPSVEKSAADILYGNSSSEQG